MQIVFLFPLKGVLMAQFTETDLISHKLQQGMTDWNPSPLVPKAFQSTVQSAALNDAIERIAALARAPLEEALRCQQEQIEALQAMVQKLELTVHK